MRLRANFYKWPPRTTAVGNGSDAYEFDKTNPMQGMREFLETARRIVKKGRGAEAAEMMRQRGEDTAADMVEGLIRRNADPYSRIMDEVIEVTNGGDLDVALAVINRAQDAGKLTVSQTLRLKEAAYERVGDTEMELETVEMREELAKETYGYKADLLYQLGRYDELAKWCDVWEGSYEDRTGLYLNRARLMYSRGDAAGAQRHLDAIIKLDDHIPGTDELAGDILAGAGDLRGAVKRYNAALDIDFNDAHIHVRKAEALMKMGRPGAAALACRRGLDIRPQNKRLKEILAEAGG